MKTWLTRYTGWLLALVTVASFALGWYAGKGAADREAMSDLPDPERCALCGEGTPRHAPCLVDLATGQVGEMTVYARHPTLPGQVAPMEAQPTGTLCFQPCAGLLGVRDTCAHTCAVILPEEGGRMDPALFCGTCRRLLAQAGTAGYVMADLYDPERIQAYPIREGETQVIRDYRVSVSGGPGSSLEVRVAGLR